MKLSLKEVSIKAVDAYSKIPRSEWVLQWPGQVVLAASQIHWTAEVTQVYIKGSFMTKSNHGISDEL